MKQCEDRVKIGPLHHPKKKAGGEARGLIVKNIQGALLNPAVRLIECSFSEYCAMQLTEIDEKTIVMFLSTIERLLPLRSTTWIPFCFLPLFLRA